MKKHFFSIYILTFIVLSNVTSTIIYGLNNDWPSFAFNILIALFAMVVVSELRKDIQSDQNDFKRRENEPERTTHPMTYGRCCSSCGKYFEKSHGYPVECHQCWTSTSENKRATIDEIK